MKRTIVFGMVLAAGGLIAATADAGTIDASAVITAQAAGAEFDYTITLTNTSGVGNDNIATFWFGWVPGKDFMADAPISVTDPTGWKDVVTHGGSTDGYAIQFDALTSASSLSPGGSLTFSFVSPDTPAELAGDSKFYTSFPVQTSFVYSQGPFQGDGHEFVVNGRVGPRTVLAGPRGHRGLRVARLLEAPSHGDGLTRNAGRGPSGTATVPGPLASAMMRAAPVHFEARHCGTGCRRSAPASAIVMVDFPRHRRYDAELAPRSWRN